MKLKRKQTLTLQEYGRYSINPITENKELNEEELEEKAKEIFEWALSNGATHYTFWAYPQTQGVCEKQDAFLDLKYFYEGSLGSKAKKSFKSSNLLKSEGDGSSFPSGGLRATHSARAYMMWDTKSDIFLRKKNNVLYIPSILVSHDGSCLDDKTLLRNTEIRLQQWLKRLLQHLGITTNHTYIALGVEQEFFIIPKASWAKRLDIRNTGRALISNLPPRNQQFSDHYYGKLPSKFEQIMIEIQKQLLEIGVPCKTRHKEVAINQFEFCSLYEEAGKSIDHNMITMEILKEVFDQHGYTVLLHEKPFGHSNGSGKHCNWSLNYVNADGDSKNLFSIPREGSDKEKNIFKIIMLITLAAIQNNAKLYLSSITTAGNELRLGGHEAPPRIISAFLGEAVTSLLDGEAFGQIKNFKGELPNVSYNLFQEDTDRNRTSPYAWAGNKFQFRAVGSSQNVSFPMAVIAATIAQETMKVVERLDKGETLEKIIEELTVFTRKIRFEGNGYSPQWVVEAKKRGLYVNTELWESIQNLKDNSEVFVNIGACGRGVLQAKYHNVANLYINTVNTEYSTLQLLLSRQIIPRCYAFANTISQFNHQGAVKERSERFTKLFDELAKLQTEVNSEYKNPVQTTEQAGNRRKKIHHICDKVNEVIAYLPKSHDFPDLEDFMNIY